MAAVFTFNPCETAVKVAAIQIAMDDIYYTRSPESKAGGVSIVPDLFEFLEMGFYALVIGAGAGITRAINVSWAAIIGGDSPIIWIDRHVDRSLRHNVNINVNLNVRHRKGYCKDCSGPPPIIA